MPAAGSTGANTITHEPARLLNAALTPDERALYRRYVKIALWRLPLLSPPGDYSISGLVRAATEVVNVLPVQSPVARIAALPTRILQVFVAVLKVLCVIAIAIVCVDLCVELAISLWLLLADVANAFSVIAH